MSISYNVRDIIHNVFGLKRRRRKNWIIVELFCFAKTALKNALLTACSEANLISSAISRLCLKVNCTNEQ